MSEKSANILRKSCAWAAALLLIVAGICFMVACADIYRQGAFSREAVAAAFAPIAFPVYLCLAAVAISFLIHGLFPATPTKLKGEKNDEAIARRLWQKVASCPCAMAEQKKRKKLKFSTGIILGVCLLVCLVYWCDGSHFHPSQINSSIIRAMDVLMPASLVALCVSAGCFYGCRKSLQEEIRFLQNAPKDAQAAVPEKPVQKYRAYITWGILALALGCLIFGFFTGGTADVLTKAVNICTECVGLG